MVKVGYLIERIPGSSEKKRQGMVKAMTRSHGAQEGLTVLTSQPWARWGPRKVIRTRGTDRVARSLRRRRTRLQAAGTRSLTHRQA